MAAITHVQDVGVNLSYNGYPDGIQATLANVSAGSTLIFALSVTSISTSTVTVTDTSGNTWQVASGTGQNPPMTYDTTTQTYVFIVWAANVAAAASLTVTVTLSGGAWFSAAGSLSEWNGISSEVTGIAMTDPGSDGLVVSTDALTVPAGGLLVGAAHEDYLTITPNAPLIAFASDTSGTTGYALPGTTSFAPQWATTNGGNDPVASQAWQAVAVVFANTNENTVAVNNPGDQIGVVGTPVRRAFTATDSVNGQTLTWSATGLPTGLSINETTGVASGTPTAAGTYSTAVTATDTTGSVNAASFTWTIDAAARGPYGTTLRPIDGGANYYAQNGFTEAHNAGLDGPTFFPIGIWDALLNTQDDANRWMDLGINMAWEISTGDTSLLYPTNPIYTVVLGGSTPGTQAGDAYTLGAETVGSLAYDEPPYMTSWETPIQLEPNSDQDSRFWWTNFTVGNVNYGVQTSANDTALVPLSQVLTTGVQSPDGTERHNDVASVDIYWFSGANDTDLLESGGIAYSLQRSMTTDEAARGCHYGDAVDWVRTAAPALSGGNGASAIPLLLHVENGGPTSTDTSVSNTAIGAGSSGGQLSAIASWSAPSAGVLDVASTSGFDASGTIFVATSTTLAQVTYTGLTESSFTGCAYVNGSADGTVANGGLVYQSDYITPPQMNQAVWSAIIHGVRNISYFNNTFTGPSVTDDDFADAYFQTIQAGQTISMYDQAKATNALIAQLTPVLYSAFLTNYFTVDPAPVVITPFDPDSGIDAMAKYYTAGGALTNGFYIFATPRESQTATDIIASFTTIDGYSGPVTVVNESRTVTATNGVFSDAFATGTSVHIYLIPYSGSSGTLLAAFP